MPELTGAERQEAIRRGLISGSTSDEQAYRQAAQKERTAKREEVKSKGGRYGGKYYRKGRRGRLYAVSGDKYEAEYEEELKEAAKQDMSRPAREAREQAERKQVADEEHAKAYSEYKEKERKKGLSRIDISQIPVKEDVEMRKRAAEAVAKGETDLPLYDFTPYGVLYAKAEAAKKEKEVKLETARKEFKESPLGKAYEIDPQLQGTITAAPKGREASKEPQRRFMQGLTLLPRGIGATFRGETVAKGTGATDLLFTGTKEEQRAATTGFLLPFAVPIAASTVGAATAATATIRFGTQLAGVGVAGEVGKVAAEQVSLLGSPAADLTYFERKAIEKRYEPEFKMARVVEKEKGLLERFAPKGLKPEGTFEYTLKGYGLTPEEIAVAKTQQIGRRAGAVTTFIGAGVVGEMSGAKGVFKALKSGKKTLTEGQIFKKIFPALTKAGAKEGSIQEFYAQQYSDTFKPSRVAAAGLIGAGTAGTLGSSIIAKTVTSPKVSKIGLVGAYTIDPAELISDKVAAPFTKRFGVKMGLTGKKVKVFTKTPTISGKTPTTTLGAITPTSVRAGRSVTVRTPTPLPAFTPTTTPIFTPTITPTTTPTTTPVPPITPTPTFTSIFTTTPTTTTTPVFTTTTTPVPTYKGFFGPYFGSLGGGGGGYGGFGFPKAKRQTKAYTPSLTAAALGIKGKASKIGVLSGLGLRPIQTTIKKSKRRKY